MDTAATIAMSVAALVGLSAFLWGRATEKRMARGFEVQDKSKPTRIRVRTPHSMVIVDVESGSWVDAERLAKAIGQLEEVLGSTFSSVDVGGPVDGDAEEEAVDETMTVGSRSAEASPTAAVGSSLESLKQGDVWPGVISSITDHGAFVDLGGTHGLVTIDDMSWVRLNHPSDLVEVGQQVMVEVREVDLPRKRVWLSMKATQNSAWDQFVRTHSPDAVTVGKVAKFTRFGAFVRLDTSAEGFVHLSEWPKSLGLAIGDDVSVQVIGIQPHRRHIALSLRRGDEAFNARLAQRRESRDVYYPDDVAQGRL